MSHEVNTHMRHLRKLKPEQIDEYMRTYLTDLDYSSEAGKGEGTVRAMLVTKLREEKMWPELAREHDDGA